MPNGDGAADPSPEETAARDVELSSEWDGTPAGVVGFAEGGWKAIELAGRHGELVERLVLVSTPISDEPSTLPLAAVLTKTLLLHGSKDPVGGHRQATWWKDRLGARIEMVAQVATSSPTCGHGRSPTSHRDADAGDSRSRARGYPSRRTRSCEHSPTRPSA